MPQAPAPTSRRALAALAIAIVGIRLLLLPAEGHVEDLDALASWVHWLTAHPFGEAFTGLQLPYGPVVTWLFGLMAAGQPLFATESTSVDLAIRLTLKAPAVLADLALAGLVWWDLRGRLPGRPNVALAAGAAVGLSPALAYVSGWWGQYDSLYALPALAAFVLATRGRRSWAAVAMMVAVLTKPQAALLVPPFAGWLLAQGGPRAVVRPALAALAAAVLLWLPFLPHGGLQAYLSGVVTYRSQVFAVLSVRAWNPWWILQTAGTGGDFASDQTAILGPITFRAIGLAVALALELVVFLAVLRRPTNATLGWGMAAASLAAFVALTGVHERHAYAVLVFLPALFPDRRAVALWGVLTVVTLLNLVAAAPFSSAAGSWIAVDGPLGYLGGGLVTAAVVRILVTLRRVAAGP